MQTINISNELKKHLVKRYKRRKSNQIDSIIVHHSATKSGGPKAFADYHVTKNNWPGIGYHFVIMPDGLIYQTNDDTTISYHAAPYNTRGIGICLVGNFDEDEPTPAQQISLMWLIRDLKSKYNIKQTLGHREVPGVTKSCPGINFDMDWLRGEVNA